MGAAGGLRFADGRILPLGPTTRVMGVLNVTPDSFSDGGRTFDPERALRRAVEMAVEGADLIDVGGESTRPGAAPVAPDEEAARVVPVIEAVRRELPTRISIDTRRAAVARWALDAGADLINDVSALADPEMAPLAAESGAPVVLMHMRGTPRTMARLTRYDDIVAEVGEFLRERAESAVNAGIADDKIIVDPGIGFAKSVTGNLTLLRRLDELRERSGCPVLVGASRKSFIGTVLDVPVDDRLEGGLAVAAYASAQGASVIRTHDVAATVRVVRMIDAIRGA